MSGAILRSALAALLGLAVLAAAAAEEIKTVRLAVSNMSCALCPITVRKALEKTRGVQQATVDFALKTATVRFDPRATDEQALVRATTKAGFPSKVQP
jgi:mercuric ion binding protein